MKDSLDFDIEIIKYRPKKMTLNFNKFNGHLVRYRELSIDSDAIWTRQFLFTPKKFRDGWHWLDWIYVRHIPNAFDWFNEYFSKDEFLLYKLSNNLIKVKH